MGTHYPLHYTMVCTEGERKRSPETAPNTLLKRRKKKTNKEKNPNETTQPKKHKQTKNQNTQWKKQPRTKTHIPPIPPKKQHTKDRPSTCTHSTNGWTDTLEKPSKPNPFPQTLQGLDCSPPAHPWVRTPTQVPSLSELPAVRGSLWRQHRSTVPTQLWNTATESQKSWRQRNLSWNRPSPCWKCNHCAKRW